MKRAAAYIRVSTDDQVEYSPSSQLKALKIYAEKNDIQLLDNYIFIDEGLSGKTTNKREAFNKMIATAKTKPKPFDVILVWKYSRFARNREDSVVYKSMLRKQLNIDVVSVSEDVGNDKMSIIFEAIIEAMDEYYSINLAEEVKRGMTEKARRGEALSIPPFGYMMTDGKFEIVEKEAIIIKKVFADYIDGKEILNIARELNAIGVKTHRGNIIESRTVEYWLNNPVYVGKIRWNPVRATSRNYDDENIILSNGEHKSIISNKIWNKTQKKLKSDKEHYTKNMVSHREKLSHWCVGIARCGICSSTLANTGGSFVCGKKYKGLCDGNGSVSVKKMEKTVVDALKDVFGNEDFLVGILTDKKTDNAEKNKIARYFIKEIIKTGDDGKTLNIIFWE